MTEQPRQQRPVHHPRGQVGHGPAREDEATARGAASGRANRHRRAHELGPAHRFKPACVFMHAKVPSVIGHGVLNVVDVGSDPRCSRSRSCHVSTLGPDTDRRNALTGDVKGRIGGGFPGALTGPMRHSVRPFRSSR